MNAGNGTGMVGAASRTPANRVVALTGLLAAAVGAGLLYAYGAIVIAVHGPLSAGDPGESHADPISAGLFPLGVVLCTAFGTVLAAYCARRAKRPVRSFVRCAIGLTLLSFALPLSATHTTTATRLLLAGGHVLAAAIVIPVLAQGVRRAAVENGN